MNTSPRPRCFPRCRAGALLAAVSLGCWLSTAALAGPEIPPAARRTTGDRPAAAACRQVVDSLLGTCGLDAFVPKATSPDYLLIAGPAPMRIRPRAVPPSPRRTPRTAPDTGKPAPAPTSPAAEPPPTAAPAQTPGPATPALDALPEESALLPGTGPTAGQSRTEEMLSYFHRPAAPAGNSPRAAGPGADDPANPSAFLQAPLPAQSPEPAPLPPSRATYRVVP